MRTQIIKLMALLLFASVTISGCSVEYRERHGHHDQDHRDDHHDDHHDHNNNYRNSNY